MEQSVEEIVESFEIVDKQECSSDYGTSTNFQDDESNNNHNMFNSSTITSSDTNNNQAKIRKFSRDELIKMKQTMAPTEAPISEEVKQFIYKEKKDLSLDATLTNNRANRGNAIDNMMPQYANRNSYSKQRSVDGYTSGGRRSQQGNRSQSSQNLIQIHKNLIKNEDVKLNTAENAWKPTAMVKDVDLPEEEAKTAELLKQFRSILNKITPENFKTLIAELKLLKIDTVERLDGCISLVFEKAITEPNYSANYASLCQEVSNVFIVPLDDNNSQQEAVFKKRLITRCQNEFMKHREGDVIKANEDKLKAIEDETDELKKEELKADMEEQNLKIRRRAVGTVHFIGELYKINMLTSRIMNSCITYLLDPLMCSEETLECLCKLLTTIGKRLEDKNDPKKIDLSEYFKILSQVSNKKHSIEVNSRIRFMIQDLIELRLNHWTPRRLQQINKPLTMDEIKKQVEQEQYSNKMDIRESETRNRNNVGSANKPKGNGGTMVNEDGWSTQYSKKSINFDVKKLTNLPQSTDSIVLGGGVPSFQNFSSNRFMGLDEHSSSNQQNDSFSNNNNRQYSGRHSGGGQNINNRNSYDRNNRRNNNNNNSNNRSAGSRSLQPMGMNTENLNHMQFPTRIRAMSRPNDLPKPSMQRKISAPARPMTDRRNENLIIDQTQVSDAIKKSVNAYQSKEITMNDVIEKMQKYKIETGALFEIFNWSFDQHDRERYTLTDILCSLIDNGLTSAHYFNDALKEIFKTASDLACDIPHIYLYLGQFLAQPLFKKILRMQDIYVMSKDEIDAENGGKVIENILKIYEQKYEKKSLLQLYKENAVDFDFQQFLNDDSQLFDFLKQKGFDYLIENTEDEEPLMVLDEETITEIRKVLKANDDVDALIAWVRNHFKDPSDPGFIRSLTDLVLESCLHKESQGYRVDKQKLEKTSGLLVQFIDSTQASEIQCLYAINAKIVEIEHAVGCAYDIFTCFYDNFVFSKKSFNKWKEDKNPKEQEGKGVTLKSITQFIIFLKEEDSTGEEN